MVQLERALAVVPAISPLSLRSWLTIDLISLSTFDWPQAPAVGTKTPRPTGIRSQTLALGTIATQALQRRTRPQLRTNLRVLRPDSDFQRLSESRKQRTMLLDPFPAG